MADNRWKNARWPSEIIPTDDLSATLWLQDPARWTPWHTGPLMLDTVVPTGYGYYLRLNYPAWWRSSQPATTLDETPTCPPRPVPWSEVARWAHKSLVNVVSFSDLVPEELPQSEQAPWTDPPSGLSESVLKDLVPVLRSLTKTPNQIWMAFWDGSGLWNGSDRTVSQYGQTSDPMRAVQTRVRLVPRWSPSGWEDHGRRYWLAIGSLDAILNLSSLHIEPNLWWPNDRAWFISQEVDWDTAVIGTTQTGAERLSAISGLDIDPI